jgi:hypothetical protein
VIVGIGLVGDQRADRQQGRAGLRGAQHARGGNQCQLSLNGVRNSDG